MITVSQIKLPITHTEAELLSALCKALKTEQKNVLSYKITKRSLDARRNQPLCYVYTVEASIQNENKVLKANRNPNVSQTDSISYQYTSNGDKQFEHPPVIVGCGPAGLFCAYFLALEGYRPILIERGDSIENRTKALEKFWSLNELDPESNAQFGEGGAGTYSDGKLNTMVKDKTGRIKKVLETFVSFGAPQEILYHNKPHIGTDHLRHVIITMRKEIIALGGTIQFRSKLTDIFTKDGQITSIEINQTKILPCEVLVLAIGHSARDTFELLNRRGISMEPKPFAIGVRVEHPQSLINHSQYHLAESPKIEDPESDNQKNNKKNDCILNSSKDLSAILPPADYKLTHQTKDRGVYSFCMCPGGFVVNASSEPGLLTVNGMSNYARNEKNANSAIVVTVNPEDFKKTISRNDFKEVLSSAGCYSSEIMDADFCKTMLDSPLLGVAFQRYWERKTYVCGEGKIPVQKYGDLINHVSSDSMGEIQPNTKGAYTYADLHECLPEDVLEAILEGMEAFGKKIPGFDRKDTVVLGIEARTSSPVRITRDEDMNCTIKGILPCGEGAGYAGGIVSAAVDGIRVFETIIKRYRV